MSTLGHARRLAAPVRRMTRDGMRTALRPMAYGLNRRRYRRCALVFNFHQSTGAFDPARHDPGTWTSIADLETQLVSIRDRWPVLPLPEALRHVDARTATGWVAALTFDDGDASLATHIVPLLDRLDLPAALFVNSAHLDDGPQPWTRAVCRLAAEGDADARDLGRVLRHTRSPAEYDLLRRRVEGMDSARGPLPGRTVTRAWLETLDPARFVVGLHGHEHQRFGLMSPDWQGADLDANRAALADLPAYRPYFAIPFGRPHDWGQDTLDAARVRGLAPLLAHGGVHARRDAPVRRIPLDGRRVEAVLTREIAGL